MRKDRNTFFSESNMFQANQPMMYSAPMMQNPAPYQASSASNSFYTGPNPNMVAGMAPAGMIPNTTPTNTVVPVENYQTNNTVVSNLESRLAKMERQIRRLETRLNKLESNYSTAPYTNAEEIDANYSSSMYMI